MKALNMRGVICQIVRTPNRSTHQLANTLLFKQFMDNESFRRWLTDTVFGLTYERPNAS